MNINSEDLAMASYANTINNIAKRRVQIPINLPSFSEGSPVKSFTMLDSDPHSVFGYWYAGIIVANSDKNSLLNIILIPQNNGELLIAKTQVEKEIIQSTTIIKKMEAKGMSFGALRLSKMEASFYFRQYKKATFTESTQLSLHDKYGVKIKEFDSKDFNIELPKSNIDGLVNSMKTFSLNSTLQNGEVNSDVSLFINTSEGTNRCMYYLANASVNANSEIDLLEIDLDGDSFREVPSEEIESFEEVNMKPAGMYIETSYQGGVSMLNIIVMYSIDNEGNYYPILYNQCSNTITENFSEKIRKKKSSGFFSGKMKIKHVIKLISEVTTECGRIKTIGELQEENQLIPLQVTSQNEENVNRMASVSGSSFIENFQRALRRVQDFRENLFITSKFSKIDLGFYSVFLEERIRSPKFINQGPLNLCGPAAYLYLLAKNDPDGYAQVAIDLVIKGKASYNGLNFIPHLDMFDSEAIVIKKIEVNGVKEEVIIRMNPVDWITMSSLRQTENLLFPYNPIHEFEFSAITTHWEMTSWVEDINNIKDEIISGSPGVTALNDLYHSGKQVLLLIDVGRFLGGITKEKGKGSAKGFEEKMTALFSPLFGNHYAVIESPIEVFGSKQYRLTIWTWGRYSEIIVNKDDFDTAIKKTFVIAKES